MILSPRAGGVGLTLTTANHVIHLSRWWNPAVEDQCLIEFTELVRTRRYMSIIRWPFIRFTAKAVSTSFLNALLTRKRYLSQRMLLPPVNLKQDQNWFAENLGRKVSETVIAAADIDEIDVMEPKAFERWALSRCISLGWEVSQTPASYDGGADGILLHRETGARAIVQCKHKQNDNNACGPEAVDDLLRARASYAGAARLFVLTNAERFSRSAQERAGKYGIVLIGRNELPHWPRHLVLP
jgi:HJR/Mrr/RecB family endonuclease